MRRSTVLGPPPSVRVPCTDKNKWTGDALVSFIIELYDFFAYLLNNLGTTQMALCPGLF
jgi:hypothetical protein